MKNLVKLSSILLISSLAFSSCKKDDKTTEDPKNEPPAVTTPTVPTTTTTPTVSPGEEKGTMKIQFTHLVDGVPLVFGDTYTNASNEGFTVSKFNFYVSNIVLTRQDDSQIKINDFYRIVKASSDSSQLLNLGSIPAGSYKSIKLMLGVDSTRNYSGAQSGGLEIGYAADMYWGWSQGYIFLKFEGLSTTSPSGDLAFHIGGYDGPNRGQREMTIDFGSTEAKLTKNGTTTINLNVNIAELFKNPSAVSFTKFYKVLSPGTKDAKIIADNYADLISFGSISN